MTGLAVTGDVLVAGSDYGFVQRYDANTGEPLGEPIEMPNGTRAMAATTHLEGDGTETPMILNGDDQGILRRLNALVRSASVSRH